MSARQWTADQAAAIEGRGNNLLVSAGAGAGKTSVLVERIWRRLSDPRAPGSMERLLVVTFTRAAASEMRERLAARLQSELASGVTGAMARHLQGQLHLLPRANVSTIHSFCISLLREFPEGAGVAPDFDIMSEEEAALVRREIIDEAIEDVLGGGSSELLTGLFQSMSPLSAPEAIRTTVHQVVSFLEALAWPARFCEESLEDYRRLADRSVPWWETRLGAALRDQILDGMESLAGLACGLRDACGRGELGPSFRKARDEVASLCEDMEQKAERLRGSGLLFAELSGLPRKPSLRGDPGPGDVTFHAFHGTIQQAFKKRLEKVKAMLPPGGAESLRDLASASLPMLELLAGPLGMEVARRLNRHHLALRRLRFADCERLALRLLAGPDGAPTPAALACRARYDEVLVDEFQDVNELQATLLRSVSRPAPCGNLFVVGDIKQSIYGFRLADPSQFLQLHRAYPPIARKGSSDQGWRIDLRSNFRSLPALLREFNDVFACLFRESMGGVNFDEEHRFEAPDTPPPEAPLLDVHLLHSDGGGDATEEEAPPADDDGGDEVDVEAVHVASLIRGMGRPWGDVAVLLRSGGQAVTHLVEAFRAAGIPYRTEANIGLLAAQEVQDVLSLLQTIRNPLQDVALVGSLRGPAGGWTPDQLLLLRAVDRAAPLWRNLRAQAASGGALSGLAGEFLVRIERWRDMACRVSMGDLMECLDTELQLTESLSALPNGEQRRLNLAMLVQRARQFDAFRRRGLVAFLAFLEDMLERDEDLGQPSPATGNENVVRIMTIHKSKGLEFPVVVLPGLGRKFNLRDTSRPVLVSRDGGLATKWLRGGMEAPAETLCTVLGEGIRRSRLSEELRLLYVALTRARHRVVATASIGNWTRRLDGLLGDEAGGTRAREQRLHSAGCFADWLLVVARDRGMLAGLSSPAGVATSGGTRFQLVDATRTGAVGAPPPGTSTPAGWNMEEQALAGFGAAATRLAAGERGPRSSLSAKVTATQARRAALALDPESAVPFAPGRETADSSFPRWYPEGLLDLEGGSRQAGTRRGTIMHRVLAQLDLDALRGGVLPEKALPDGFLTADEAPLVSWDAIHWFLDSDLGRRLLAGGVLAYRELPFTMGVPAGDLAPGCPGTMVFQGVADLLFEGAAGLVLVDFKTDYCGEQGERMPDLERQYAPQMHLYQLGLEAALARPVVETWLVLLQGRMALWVPPLGESGFDWKEALRQAGRVPTAGGVAPDAGKRAFT